MAEEKEIRFIAYPFKSPTAEEAELINYLVGFLKQCEALGHPITFDVTSPKEIVVYRRNTPLGVIPTGNDGLFEYYE